MVEIMLGFFALEGNPLLWGKCIAAMDDGEYCILREDTVRERRGSYNGFCCRLYPFICWIIIKEGPTISLVDVAHTGWTM